MIAYMEFFNEAVEWMSYTYKARSKPESGTVYFSDRQDDRHAGARTHDPVAKTKESGGNGFRLTEHEQDSDTIGLSPPEEKNRCHGCP